jgi:hypothetical protein
MRPLLLSVLLASLFTTTHPEEMLGFFEQYMGDG